MTFDEIKGKLTDIYNNIDGDRLGLAASNAMLAVFILAFLSLISFGFISLLIAFPIVIPFLLVLIAVIGVFTYLFYKYDKE